MLDTLKIRNYQSLSDVSLELGRFTVIVGPSSSGKSALVRALKTLTGNARGDSFITHGESQCTISAHIDRGTVSLDRGKTNAYKIIPEGDSLNARTFTKLGGSVPEEISAFLGIPAKDALNFADQFDMPYLLTASPGEVARTLGELTNVSVIFDAAREANRQRLSASSTLKTRVTDLDQCATAKEDFTHLELQLASVDSAKKILDALLEVESRKTSLEKILGSLERLQAVEPKSVVIPSTTELEKILERKSELARILTRLESLTEARKSLKAKLAELEKSLTIAEDKRLETLRDMKVCPTCGQNTEHVH